MNAVTTSSTASPMYGYASHRPHLHVGYQNAVAPIHYHNHHVRPIRPSFAGSLFEDPVKFIEKYTRFLKEVHAPEDYHLDYLDNCLHGDAASWWDEWKYLLISWAEVQPRFLRQFNGEATRRKLEDILYDKRQTRETAEIFLLDAHRIWRRLQLIPTSSIPEKNAVEAVIFNMKRRHQQRFNAKGIVDFESAIALAIELECPSRSTPSPRPPVPALKPRVAASSSQVPTAVPAQPRAVLSPLPQVVKILPPPTVASTPSPADATTPSHADATTSSQADATTPSPLDAATPSPAATPLPPPADSHQRLPTPAPPQIVTRPMARVKPTPIPADENTRSSTTAPPRIFSRPQARIKPSLKSPAETSLQPRATIAKKLSSSALHRPPISTSQQPQPKRISAASRPQTLPKPATPTASAVAPLRPPAAETSTSSATDLVHQAVSSPQSVETTTWPKSTGEPPPWTESPLSHHHATLLHRLIQILTPGGLIHPWPLIGI